MHFWQKSQVRIQLWQVALLTFGTTWLWAPLLNQHVSNKITLISQYEIPAQPFAWLFRFGDVIGGLLVLYAARCLYKRNAHLSAVGLLAVIGVGMVIDPVVSVRCIQEAKPCVELHTTMFFLHAFETAVTGLAIFGLSIYDYLKRHSLPSLLFIFFQLLYGLLFVSQLSVTYNLQTLSQFMYQLLSIIWLCWIVGEYLTKKVTSQPLVNSGIAPYIKRGFGLLAALNGILAILLGLTHFHHLGFIRDFYFAGSTPWLAQHGIIVGVALLYTSRHLVRGEKRARQLFLVLAFLQIIKYGVISPQPELLALYIATFALIFIAWPYFDRGTVKLSWQNRFQDVGVIVGGALVALLAAGMLLSRSRFRSEILSDAVVNFRNLAFSVQAESLESSLLAHSLLALIAAVVGFVLWSLFRPTRIIPSELTDEAVAQARDFICVHAESSEDYFKIWPNDKRYFWSQNHSGLVAYKIAGSIAFALADPLATSTTAKADVLQEFIAYCRSHGWRACFVLLGEDSLLLYKDAGLKSLHIGASATVNIPEFMDSTVKSKWLRWQSNRGDRAGYTYHNSLSPHSSGLMVQFQKVSDEWLTRNDRQEQSFALGYYDYHYLQQCTIHYIKDPGGKVVAFVNELPILNNLRQTTIDLIRYNETSDGVMPYLLIKVLQNLHEQEYFKTFDLGFVPLAQMQGSLARMARVLGDQRFSMAGLEQFKGKFKPVWHKNYIAYDGDTADLALIVVNLEKVTKKSSLS